MKKLDRCEAFHPTDNDLSSLTRCDNAYNTHVNVGDYIYRLCVECGSRVETDCDLVPIIAKD